MTINTEKLYGSCWPAGHDWYGLIMTAILISRMQHKMLEFFDDLTLSLLKVYCNRQSGLASGLSSPQHTTRKATNVRRQKCAHEDALDLDHIQASF